MSDYRNTFRRLEKIKATMDALLAENKALRAKLKKRDEPLIAKVRRLEEYRSTTEQRWQAELRVAKSFLRKELEEEPIMRDMTREQLEIYVDQLEAKLGNLLANQRVSKGGSNETQDKTERTSTSGDIPSVEEEQRH